MSIKIKRLPETLQAAGYVGAAKQKAEISIRFAVIQLAKFLKLSDTETLHCFFSPHRAPRRTHGKSKFPRAFGFVIPRLGERLDRYSVKAVFWIMNGRRMISDSKCRTFFTQDGYAQIADDDWVSPEVFAKEMGDHLRRGKQLSYYLSAPMDHVQSILKL